MMKSIRFTEFGPPEQVLSVENLPVPEPAADEVLIRLQSRPINPSDLYLVMGTYGVKPKPPASPGLEGAGVVERLGAEVTQLHLGQKVVPVKSGVGTWQEYMVAKANQVVPVPDDMPIESASMLIANPFSAYLMTRVLMEVPPGEWLIQTAAGSAVGRMVIQLGKIFGFKTINVVRRAEQKAELLALGADAVISTADENLSDRVAQITTAKGVRYAIDAVSGPLGTQIANSLKVGGIMLIYGAMDTKPVILNPGAMIFKELTVKGFWVTRWFAQTPEEQKAAIFPEIIQLVKDGKLSTPVAARYPLDNITEAVLHAQRAARGGKILLVG